MSEHFWKLKSPKFAPRLCASTIWKSKSLKTERFGALLEVEARKICTTPARENDLEVEIVKTPGAGDFLKFKVLFAWQTQGFRHSILIKIAKTYCNCNSEVKCLVSMSCFREVSQNSQSISQSVSRSVSQPVSQSDSQSVSQSVNQSVSQSVR